MARIGQIRVLLGDRAEGERWYKQTLVSYQAMADKTNEALIHRRLGMLYEWQGDLDDAVDQFKAAGQISRHIGDELNTAKALGEIADILQARGQLDQALQICLAEVLPVYEKLGDQVSLVWRRFKVARMLLERDATGDRQKATELLRLSLENGRQMRLPNLDFIELYLKAISPTP